MSSSGLHIQVCIFIHTPQMYTSVYMHAYTTDGETYIHVERQTDINQETESETHTEKNCIFSPGFTYILQTMFKYSVLFYFNECFILFVLCALPRSMSALVFSGARISCQAME